MRVAIVGAAGQLGSALAAEFADLAPALVTHDAFELEEPGAAEALLERVGPDVVINTAAFHNVDRCEAEPERAFGVNAAGVARLASACAAAGVAIAHVSTDYVFDGGRVVPYRETDEAHPLNTYGISKLAGEAVVRGRARRSFVFRTAGLYAARGSSAKGKPFIARMLEGAAAGTPLRVVSDVTFSPSYAPHVAAAIRRIVEREAYGTYHVTDRGACTWHEFASEIVRRGGYDVAVEKTATTPGPVRRPAFSALAHDAMEALGLGPMPAWQDGIAAYLEERAALATHGA